MRRETTSSHASIWNLQPETIAGITSRIKPTQAFRSTHRQTTPRVYALPCKTHTSSRRSSHYENPTRTPHGHQGLRIHGARSPIPLHRGGTFGLFHTDTLA